ncbi:ABC transporter permease [Hathewaya limosa]|uniref:ABC-2 type transport system permease protein n=1 Tax=Hathewaya limosa TaxID=1536 RepID=A0ABU0JN29_HATLI|nr:ABC transporter permease [Hathewaya limosa]MDQ0478468.1 ABC-2 type transport system permease protein [Hathewaya limosa]
MNNILSITKNILKQAFRRKSNLLTFILLPIIGILISLGVNNNTQSLTKVGLVDLNNTYLSQDMVKSIGDNKNFTIQKVDEKYIEESLLNKYVDCILVIPKGFDKEVYKGDIKKLNIISLRGQDITSWIENYVNYYVENLSHIGKASNNNNKIFDKIYKGYKDKKLKLKDVAIKDISVTKSVTRQSIGFLLVFMLMASSVTSNFIMKDKCNRTYFRTFCAPVSKTEYIISNILANFVIFLIQILLILFMSLKVFKMSFYISTPIMFMILCSFGLACIGFGIVISAFSKTISQASQLSNVLIVPTCMLAGCYWPIEIMPKWLQNYSNLFPQAWIIKTIEAMQYGKSFSEVYINIVFVLIFAVVLFAIGIFKMYRDENLKNIL